MRQFRVTGLYYTDGPCPCGGHCAWDEDDPCDCDCDCDPTTWECECGREDPDESRLDLLVSLNVPVGASARWLQEAAEAAALKAVAPTCDGDPWFATFDPPLVEEEGQEPLDVFLWRVGAAPLPGFAEAS